MKKRAVFRVRALYAYQSEDTSSLSFKAGALIDVWNQLDSGWWDGWYGGRRGWFPSNYVELEEDDWILQVTEDGSGEYYYNKKTHEMKCADLRIHLSRGKELVLEEDKQLRLNGWTKPTLINNLLSPPCSPKQDMTAMVAQTIQTLKECVQTGSRQNTSQVKECIRLLLTDKSTDPHQLVGFQYRLLSAANQQVLSSETTNKFLEWANEVLEDTVVTKNNLGSLNSTPWFLKANLSELLLEKGKIKGGTLNGLVKRLTQHDHLDTKFNITFLLTYRSFSTTEELFCALFQRYQILPPENLSSQEVEMWREKKLKLVRLRVFNIIKLWLETYLNEEQDRSFLPILCRFTDEVISNSMSFGADQLQKLLKKRMSSEDVGQLRKMRLNIKADSMPEPILPKSLKRIQLLDLDPHELARQMTLLDFRLYNRIKAAECLDKNWGKPDSNTAIYVKALIEHTNQVTSWVTDSILSHDELKKRAAILKYWISVSEQCKALNNFNTCMAILSALDNGSIGRLKRTWECVGGRSMSSIQQIREILATKRNFSAYREIIQKVNPPCIPFMGIYLQDLTFIEDGNPDLLKPSAWINFSKRMKTANVILDLQQYQSCHYLLAVVPDIQEFIKTHLQSSRDEEELYSLSLKLEPRECDEDTIARRLKEVGL
ncbi:ras guanine nucleotide exchange factor domain-containing protein [Sporodiniella umbellata]|nr:ras guanine nucleotide exchange factor domain-containing protein [Sporodiniella umbellata]